MSFSPQWLALREPADHAARSKPLLAEVGAHFAARSSIRVVDLGCGAGSNLRGTCAALPDEQHWRLVDFDPALLVAARDRLAEWADTARSEGEALILTKGAKRLTVAFRQADLSADLAPALDPAPDLVTAAALFDLVSADWIDRFVDALKTRGLPLYTVLTYDGTESWDPTHPADAAMLKAFHGHQGRDKGFGPAAGPKATAIMAEAFLKAGYTASGADSPWMLGPDQAELTAALVAGFAQAVTETDAVPSGTIASWLDAKAPGCVCRVGHQDLFAHP